MAGAGAAAGAVAGAAAGATAGAAADAVRFGAAGFGWGNGWIAPYCKAGATAGLLLAARAAAGWGPESATIWAASSQDRRRKFAEAMRRTASAISASSSLDGLREFANATRRTASAASVKSSRCTSVRIPAGPNQRPSSAAAQAVCQAASYLVETPRLRTLQCQLVHSACLLRGASRGGVLQRAHLA